MYFTILSFSESWKCMLYVVSLNCCHQYGILKRNLDSRHCLAINNIEFLNLSVLQFLQPPNSDILSLITTIYSWVMLESNVLDPRSMKCVRESIDVESWSEREILSKFHFCLSLVDQLFQLELGRNFVKISQKLSQLIHENGRRRTPGSQ